MIKILIVEDQALARMYLCSCVEKCTDCRSGRDIDPGGCGIAAMLRLRGIST
ncbi:hypothetical protein [Eubacterium ramulus]|uniref:hypothetical protein n=1 Tax=Eubacterium ramulus TaxID=39490 RepID=UPI00300F5015